VLKITFLRRILSGALLFSFFIFPLNSLAGGIALGATRVIYPADAKQASLAITNSDKSTRFLIQSWVDDANNKKSPDFIVTPPLFVSKPKSENTLRIMYVGSPLPTDRETVFWLNSKSIPAVERNTLEGKNVLQIAILSRIKLFVRPEKLSVPSSDAPSLLKFARQGHEVKITNPSPYYVTLVNIHVGTHKLSNMMIAPKSDSTLALPDSISTAMTYQTINDYGANTPLATASW